MVRQHRDPWAEVRNMIRGKAKIVSLDLVVYELERLARRGVSAGSWARASLEIIEKKNYPVVDHKPGPSEVDTALVAHALAEREVTVVATVDRELRKILAGSGVPVIWPRTRHGLLSSGF